MTEIFHREKQRDEDKKKRSENVQTISTLVEFPSFPVARAATLICLFSFQSCSEVLDQSETAQLLAIDVKSIQAKIIIMVLDPTTQLLNKTDPAKFEKVSTPLT